MCYRVVDGRPVLCDDTVYLLPFQDRDAAQEVLDALQGPEGQAFFASRIWWDAKRPVTKGILDAFDPYRIRAAPTRVPRA